MGSFSIWHLIILLGVVSLPIALIGLIVWAARRGRSR